MCYNITVLKKEWHKSTLLYILIRRKYDSRRKIREMLEGPVREVGVRIDSINLERKIIIYI